MNSSVLVIFFIAIILIVGTISTPIPSRIRDIISSTPYIPAIPPGLVNEDVLEVPNCHDGLVTIPRYWLTNVEQGTFTPSFFDMRTSLCWSVNGIYIIEEGKDDYYYTSSDQCNDPLWEMGSVFELFISRVSSPKDIPREYYEIDVSPKGTVFGTIIQNNKGETTTCPRCNIGKLNCTGISKFTDYPNLMTDLSPFRGGWKVERFLPFSIFDKFINSSPVQNQYFKFNFYRYSYPYGSSHPAELSGAYPTFSPSFHIPSRFATMVLKQKTMR